MTGLLRKKTLIPLVIVFILLGSGLCFIIKTPFKGGSAVITSGSAKQLTVVIDAGHGGEDGGAVSISGFKESSVNIAVASRLDLILGFYGTHTVMTRTSETIDYSENADTIRQKKAEDQNRRLKLINSTENAVLLSIHQNTFPDGSPFGAQVLYAPTDGSKEFADAVQKLLIGALNTKNKRTATKVPASILLMNHIKCPAILVECGFLSNPAEEKLLMTDSYRLKIAAVLAAGYLSNQVSLYNIYNGGPNEGQNSVLLH